LGYRGGLGYGGYYRPGVGLAAGALAGGAIAAGYGGYGDYGDYGGYGSYGGYGGYGGYDSGYYGYNSGYPAAYAPVTGLAARRAVATGGAFNPYTHDYAGVNAGYAYGYDPTTTYGPCAGTTDKQIMCSGQCWLNSNGTNYRWGDCPAIHAKAH
jgi:hypothetical protein